MLGRVDQCPDLELQTLSRIPDAVTEKVTLTKVRMTRLRAHYDSGE
ncbi:hypothetical protein KSP9073_02441 [Kushneria phyllosphaerae]|uniref:Uncharacterized protein n=1 Tax=Kushneria phyllosphaerae TaxID=2100822 RepID=A0A2R8CND1_9GAMM|nr:hypothetical protein KSP9073_02441 [Kushneria phyllosphaerae]